MKLKPTRARQGFTLIELLVVITIIIVLASVTLAVGNAAIERTRRLNALANATAIETAVNNFYSEYNTMPVASGDEDVRIVTNTPEGLNLLKALLGEEEDGDDVLNSKAIRFLDVKPGKGGKNGLIRNATNEVESLIDPWGGPYFVRLDLDFNEEITPDTAAKTYPALKGRRVAVWSNGADGVDAVGKQLDDVMTW